MHNISFKGSCRQVAVLLLSAAAAWAGKEFPQQPGEEVVPNQLLVKMKTGSAADAIIHSILPSAQITNLVLPDHYLVRLQSTIPPASVTALAAHNLVDYVEPDRVRQLVVAAPNDPYYSNSTSGQWGLFTVQALQAWNLLPSPGYLTAATAGVNRIKVAVLDTGADCGHPDFMNVGGSSTDSASGGQILWSASQAYVATTVPSPACTWQDDHGHGTHVTGIIAAATSNGAGVASLGYPLQVIEYKVLDSTGSGADSAIANAITAAVNAGARVVSMSVGAPGYSQTLQTAINYAWQNNVVVVAAGGNSSTNTLFFPGGANHAVGVSASDINNTLAGFSNFGSGIGVAAPGVTILSTIPRYSVTLGCCTYGYLSGTSMATPFVSALAGLVAMTTPNTTAAAIIQRLEQSAANPSGSAWNQNFGYGVINAYNAVGGLNRSTTTGGVVGQIVNGSGVPVGSAQITIAGQTTTTDASGLFWLRPITAGTYPAAIAAAGYSTQNLNVTVAAGADTPFSVTMGANYGSFVGSVTDKGVGVPGAIVQAVSAAKIVGIAVTDPAGAYRLWVPAGSGYTIQASQIGANTVSVASVAVTAGATTTVNLGVTSLYGGIAGIVSDFGGNPVAGAQVTATSASLSKSATSDASGAYSLPGLAAGSWTVTASSAGFSSTPTAATVLGDTTTAVNLQIGVPAAAPTFNPPGGSYTTPQTVTIASTTAGALIRYTTDGSTPSTTVGLLYSTPITVSAPSSTLKAIAYTGVGASAVASAVYTVNSSGWYNTGGTWSNRKKITIDHTRISGGSPLANFPVLISLTDANLQSVAKADGSDILFTAGDAVTKLNHELAQYNSATGQLTAWVNVPSVSPSVDTVLYLYYGNPAAAAQQNAAAVWDTNYKSVLHLGNGTTLSLTDSTANLNSGTNHGATAAAGKIDGAAGLASASSQYLSLPNGLSATGAITFEAWVKFTNHGSVGQIAYLSDGSNADGLAVFTEGNTLIAVATSSLASGKQATTTLADGVWYHVAVQKTAGQITKIFVNGADATAVDTTDFVSTGYLANALGIYGNQASFPLNGAIDEARISDTTRSADWITTEYNNQNSAATFYSMGAQEIQGGAAVSVTVTSSPAGRSLTVDNSACTAPCSFQWTPGSSHTIAAATQAGAAGIQYAFASWSDSGAASHSVTAASIPTTYTASFATQYFLTTSATPGAGGTIAPANGWYNSGTVVAVSASANGGYQFTSFSGALTGTTTPQNVTMNAPASVTATFTATVVSGSWYSSGGTWSNRKKITIDHTRISGASPLANFPVLISLTDANLQAAAKADGSDILFTGGDGVTKINHELAQYNSATGQLTAWVNVPAVSPSADTVLYLYYGNAAAAAQQNSAGVWDSNYKAVLHLGNGTTLNLADSTSNANNGTNHGASATAGKVDGAAGLASALTQYVSLPNGLSATGAVTFETWVKFTTHGSVGQIAYLADGSNADGLAVFTEGNTLIAVAMSSLATGKQATTTLADGVWYHVAVQKTAGQVTKIYINGADVTAADTTDFVSTGYVANVLGVYGNQASFPLNGALDEARVSNTARSADWIATEYNNQNSAGTFYSLGAQETPTGGTAVTVTSSPAGRSLTVDNSACTAPCSFQWTPGSTHTIAAATQAGAAGTQYAFASWSDSGAASHSMTAPSTATTYTANFATQYFLTTSATPGAGGAIAPASGWYNSGAVVAVSATANGGYQFTSFSGALTGTITPQNVTMNGPASVTATFTASAGSVTWYNNGGTWSNRKKITIDHTRISGASPLTNFPVLVSLTDANLQAAAKADGSDILFTAGDAVTKINHEVAQYNSATGQLTAWVNVPSVSPSVDTVLYLYYGNSAATAQQNAAGVWDSNYKSVLHMGNGSTLNLADSTANLNNGTNHGATAVAGKIDGAAGLANALTQYLSLPNGLSAAGTLTFETWLKFTSHGPVGQVAYLSDGSNTDGLAVFTEGNTLIAIAKGSLASGKQATTTVADGVWYHLAVQKTAGQVTKIYVNGVDATAADTTDFVSTGYAANALGIYGNQASFPLNGALDEARISNTTRSADWIVTEYNNQNSAATFYSVGPPETPAGGATVTVTSSPAGRTLAVDSVACTAPCLFQWAPGSTHTIAAATQTAGTGAQFGFANWSDSGAASHSVSAPSTATTYTAIFNAQYLLTTSVSPSIGGTISPATGWYAGGAVVTVSATATSGYQPAGFSGALNGMTTPQTITMNGPAAVTANFTTQALAGCPILPANNVWNTRIDQLPVDPNSAAYINTIGAGRGLHPDFSSDGGGVPYIVAPATQPAVPILFTDGVDESEPGPYPIPPNAPVEGGIGSGTDQHVLTLQTGTCKLYELYLADPQADGSWTASSGAVFDLTSNQLRPDGWTSADAAGLPILPGLIRYDEVAAGEIKHAIRVTVPQTRRAYIWPARHLASSLTGAQYPPMGQRFRLKASFDISPYTPDVQVILTALKKYGMILADNGSAWYITGAPDPRWNDTTLHNLGTVLGSNIEAVDESSLMIDPNSGAAVQPTQTTAAATGSSR